MGKSLRTALLLNTNIVGFRIQLQEVYMARGDKVRMRDSKHVILTNTKN